MDDAQGAYPVTAADLDNLKAQWLCDPCWDIEDTEGFEQWKDELREFRLMVEARWENESNARLLGLANALGCSPQVAQKIVEMRERLDRLTDIVLTLEAERDVRKMGR